LVRFVSKVAPSPLVFAIPPPPPPHIAELLRNRASHNAVAYRCGARTVLFVVSRSRSLPLQYSENSGPIITKTQQSDYFSVVRITEAIATMNADIINRIRDEIAYVWDLSRVK